MITNVHVIEFILITKDEQQQDYKTKNLDSREKNDHYLLKFIRCKTAAHISSKGDQDYLLLKKGRVLTNQAELQVPGS